MPAFDVLFDTMTQEVSAQLATVDAVAAKSATIFSIASTIAAVVPALLPLGKPGLQLKSLVGLLLLLALIAYLLTFAFFVLNYWSSNWRAGPRPE